MTDLSNVKARLSPFAAVDDHRDHVADQNRAVLSLARARDRHIRRRGDEHIASHRRERRALRRQVGLFAEKAEAVTYDRAAIMRDAHKRFRDGKRLGLGWSFGNACRRRGRRRRIGARPLPEELRRKV